MNDRQFALLVNEYGQLRDDERHATATTGAVIGLTVSVVAALGTAFWLSGSRRDAIPTVAFLLAPLIPLAVFALGAGEAVCTVFRGEQLRAIERQLVQEAEANADGWPIPSYYTVFSDLAWRGKSSWVWYVIDGCALIIFPAIVALPIVAISELWVQVIAGVAYGMAVAVVIVTYIAAFWRQGKDFMQRGRAIALSLQAAPVAAAAVDGPVADLPQSGDLAATRAAGT